jgi:peptidoglycan/LPS O-acetylase OafA/YrhL
MSTTYISKHAATPATAPPPPRQPIDGASSAGRAPASAGAVARRPAGFRRDIEGLRAVAILLVVLYHAGVRPISGGYVGVDVFFVISGFLITTHLVKELEQSGRIALGSFYGRRIVRLLPASLLVVVGTVAAAWHWMSPLAAKVVSMDALTAVGYGINVRLAVQGTDYLAAQRPPSPLQHFWSLAVEEQFYAVWPLLLMVASVAWRRRRSPSRRSAALVIGALAAVSFALCVWQTRHNQPWAYFGIHTRAWEFAIGALVALGGTYLAGLRPTLARMAGWLGLAVIVASAVVLDDDTLFPGHAAALPVLGAALAIAGGCARPSGGAEAVLRFGPLQELGRLSYSWYLWHWPVLILAPHVVGHPLNVWTNLALMAATLVPASMSLVAVENRIRFHHVFRAWPKRGLILGTTLMAVAAAVAVASLQLPTDVRGSGMASDTASLVASAQQASGASRQLGDLIQASSTVRTMPANLVPPVGDASKDFPRDGNCIASLDATAITTQIKAGCDQRGDNASTATIVLFGDSHAHQWFDALNEVALQRHKRLVILAKGGCTPAMAVTYKGDTRQRYDECAQWREDAFREIEKLRPELVLISTRTYASTPLGANGSADEAWAAALTASTTRISESGGRPVIMQDTPDPRGLNLPECVSAHPTDVASCAMPVSSAIYTGRRNAIATAAGRAGVAVIDPTPWFCTSAVCPPIIGNAMVYRDASHVTATYMKLLTPLLAEELK